MGTYYIQRGNFENRDEKNGIDKIISLQYMGAAEYEFGAIPTSLKVIRNNIEKYIYLDIPVKKGKIITVFCPNDEKENMKTFLTELGKGNLYTKGYSDFDSYINDSTFLKNKTEFWWDIYNMVMFWKKNTEFEMKFKELIKG